MGSTCNFKRRKHQHKTHINNDSHRNYKCEFSRANGGWDNWEMVQIESFSCDTKTELESRDRIWLGSLGATLNRQIPGRTQKERREAYIDKRKQYCEANAVTIKQYSEKVECEFCKSLVQKCNIPRHHKTKKCKSLQ